MEKLEFSKNAEIRRIKFMHHEEKKLYDKKICQIKKNYESQISKLKEHHINYTKDVEKEREERKRTFLGDLGNGYDYKKLYSYLTQSIKEHFDSPICFEKISKPCILKSGYTIDEFEFTELFRRNSRDPYDRTKRVDTKIPNFALRNIMELVDFTENTKERIEKVNYIDVSTQTDQFHNEKDIKKIHQLQNDIVRLREKSFPHLNKNKTLSQKNIELNDKYKSANATIEKLTKQIVIQTYCFSKLQTELTKAKKEYENAVKELKASRIQAMLNLIKYMYDNSNNWTTSLLCIELAHGVVKKLVKPSVHTVSIQVGPDEETGFFKWLFRK